MKEYITIAECLEFCKFIDYKITRTTVRNLIDKKNLLILKDSKNIEVNRKQFVNAILNKKFGKTEKTRKKEVKSNESFNDELFISVDWFQVTFYATKKSYFSKLDVILLFKNLLDIDEDDIKVSDKKGNLYKKALEYKGIYLFYGDETYNHCNLQLSGDGCRILYELLWEQEKSWFDFFDMVKKYKGKLTRIDIAIDDYKPIFKLEELEDKIKKQSELITTKYQRFRFINDIQSGISTGRTIYCGSLKSSMFFRFYEKKVVIEEDNDRLVEFNRFEIVMRDDKANSFFNKVVKSRKMNELSVSILNNYFSVFDDVSKTAYWKSWEKLIQGAEQFKFDVPRKIKTIERKKSWLKTQASTTLSMVLNADKEAKEKGLLPADYDTIDEILSYAKDKEKEEKKLIVDYINKKQKINKELY